MIEDDEILIHLFFDGELIDVTALLKTGTLTIMEPAFNDERKSSVGTASWTLNWDRDLFLRMIQTFTPIGVKVYHSEFRDLIFDGQMDPVASTSWAVPEYCDPISCEAVDFSVALDKVISQSVSYPAEVDGPAFYIYKREALSQSILYRLLELAGLSDRIAQDAPDIDQTIIHFAATKDDETFRNLIDPLLADYLWCLKVDRTKLTWIPTAKKEIRNVEPLKPSDLLTADKLRISRTYNARDGVTVQYPKTKVLPDALLWRGNLPIGDTSDPTPGEAIAAGDYWPEDSDVIETWQDYGTEYLDLSYLSGSTRLKNDDLALIASSNQYLEDIKDKDIQVDPINEENDIVYEAHRARLRYRNSGEAAARLYWSEIYGKALIRTAKVTATYPESASDPDEYSCSHVYDKESADRLVQGLYMLLTVGGFSIEFTSLRKLTPGEYYKIDQDWLDGYVQIKSRSRTFDGKGQYKYVVVRTAAFTANSVKAIASSGSGAAKPAQDGSSPKTVYMRASSQPPTPIGVSPAGWSTQIPAGTNPVWGSTAMFSSTGDQVGDWTTPVRMSGIDSGAYRGTSTTDPADPIDKDYYLYTGATTESRTQYHYYKYSAINDSWAETTASYVVMAGLSDAMAIAQQTGDTIYAAAIFTDLLAAMHLVMTGDGIIEGGYSEDSSGKPRGGYRLSASDGTLRAVGALLRNVVIQDGYADFGALRIEPEASAEHTVVATSNDDQAKTIRDMVIGIDSSLEGKLVACTFSDNAYAYLKTVYQYGSTWGISWNTTEVHIYDSSLSRVATIARYYDSSSGVTSSGVLPGDPTVTVYTGGNKMLVDLPTSSVGLEPGRVYIDDGTLKVVQ